MAWIRSIRTMPLIELGLVVAGTFAVIALGMLTGISRALAGLIGSTAPIHNIADIGPALLFLSCGLAIIAVRRGNESETERLDLARAQTDLRLSEERYRSVVETSPDPIVVAGRGGIVYANPASVPFFRAGSVSDLVGRQILDFIVPGLRGDTQEWLAQFMGDVQTPGPLEGLLTRLDGTTIEAEVSLVRSMYAGEPAVLATVRDLTARRLADEALTRYRALAESTQEIVFFFRPDGRIVDANRAAELLYGYSKQEFSTMTVAGLRAPGSTTLTGAERTRLPGDTAQFDTVHALKDGTLIDLSVTTQRVMIGDEEMLISVGRDVSDQRRALRNLQSSEVRYRTLIELSPSPIAVYGPDRKILFANRACLELLRASCLSDIVGKDATEFVEDGQDFTSEEATLPERGGPTPFRDVRLVRTDGTFISAQMATSGTTFDGREAVQVVLQDVSHLQDVAATLKRTTEDTIVAMARLAEAHDPYTSGHQDRVSKIAFAIATRMGLPDNTCEAVRLSGIVHDIGKMNVPAEILSKPGRLTEAEFEIIKTHVEAGYEVLRTIEFPWPIADIVRQHHERLDGSGYPRGLAGDEVRIEARIIAVADVVEAMASHRPYRPALGPEQALRAVADGRGTLFDPEVVDTVLALASETDLFGSATAAA